MKLSVYGRGHQKRAANPERDRHLDRIVRVGVFRRGGKGDGLIQSALTTAIARKLPNARILGYADGSFLDIMLHHPSCSSVKFVPWTLDMMTEVQVRSRHIVSDDQDLWFDVKPVPFIDGRRRNDVCPPDVLSELADIESRYYRFNADEIIDLYRRKGCRGQTEMFSTMFGIEARMSDAHIPMEDLPVGLKLPANYVAISGGWTDTSHYKAWTTEGWSVVCERLSRSGFCPVQLGKEEEPEIGGVLNMRHLNLGQQIRVLSGATAYAGSDGFFSHASAALEVPNVVLWGITPPEVWGHPGQVDVISPRARNIWWTHYHWAWDGDCRPIMDAIEPDAVSSAIDEAISMGGDR